MRSFRFIVIVVVALAVGLFTGCSRNHSLASAQRYELAGDNAAALSAYDQALSQSPENDHRGRSAILMHIGECLYRMERIPDAFATFQKAADTDAGNAAAHIRLGELLLAAGAPDRARDQAMLLLSNGPANNDAMALLGAAWTASGNLLMARQIYERILEADPKRVTVAVALADIYNQEEEVPRARAVLTSAAAADPSSALPWLATARLEEQEGNGAAAEDAYRHATAAEASPETNFRLAQFLLRSGRVAEAEQSLRRVDAQRRLYPVALADFQLLSGHSTEALAQYQSAYDVTAAQGKNNSRVTIAARIIEAEISSAFNQPEAQRATSLASTRKRLEGYRSLLDRATEAVLQSELALADGNLVLANMFASTALELAPNSAAAHYTAGMAESADGNADRARAEWQAAIDNDSHFMPAQIALAEDAIQRGNGAEADDYVRGVIRDDPGNFNALVAFSSALLLEGQSAAAAVMAHRASALDPASVEPMVLLGEVGLQTNRMADAMLNFEHAVITHPDSEEAIDGLLRVYRRGPFSYAALQKMEVIAQQPPASGTLLEIAGRLYADHGWYKEAMRALSQAVQIDPSRTTAVRVLAHLKLATGDSQPGQLADSNHEPLLQAFEADASGSRQQAIADYERAIRQGDRTGAAANNLAWIYAQQGAQLDRALELAFTAVKQLPENAAVLDTLGYVYLQRREFTTAVKVLETAARLSTTSDASNHEVAAQIRKHLSDAYLSSGQTDAATQIAQKRGPFALQR